MQNIYLDYCSSTPIHPKVYETLLKYSQNHYSNPSSSHIMGLEVSDLVENSRESIASLLNLQPSEVIFTSGATESNNLAIIGTIKALKKTNKAPLHVITSITEHSSVFNCCKELENENVEVTYLPVDKNGRVSVSSVLNAIKDNTVLVTIMHVNNETGSIQPVIEIGEKLKEYPNIRFHVDGVQGFGKVSIDLKNIDLYTLSGHKIGAPKGIGILIKKEHIDLLPLIYGGNQENGLRSGTTNVSGVLSLTEAIKIAVEEQEKNYKMIKNLHEYTVSKLKDIADLHMNSPELPLSSPHIINTSYPAATSAMLIHLFSQRGIILSSQSACSSKGNKVSRVLMEMTNDEKISSSSIRLSLHETTTYSELDEFISVFKDILNQLKSKNKYKLF